MTELLHLLGPKLRAKATRARATGSGARGLVLAFVTAVFWAILFAMIYRMLLYFRGTPAIGDLLAAKLLAIAFLTFLSILLLSNLIASLSTFFLSKDLELLVASPADPAKVYGARLMETILDSSWMVALLAVPVFAAYGWIYGAGPLFYLLGGVVLVGLLVIPAVAGSALTLLLVNVFPARRTRDLLALVAVFAAAGLIALFRFLRPERLMRPEEFRQLIDFVAELRAPSSPWLPSEWAATTLMGWLEGRFDPFPLFLLLSTAAAAVVLGLVAHQRFYASGFSRAQEGADRRSRRTAARWLEERLIRGGVATRQLVAKEVRIFFRDATQWSQLILLGVLVVVYVYNVRALPLYTGEALSAALINVISFLNLGLAGFVVAAVAARFVYPAMSLEGRMTWLLRSSPLDVRTLFWAKYWVGVVPLVAVALPLIVITNLALDVSPFLMGLTAGTILVVTLALGGLALGIGALFPNYEAQNVAEIPTSFGGLLFMMIAVVYLAAIVVLEAWPVWAFLNPGPRGSDALTWGPIVVGFGGAALLTLLVAVVPIAAGIRAVRGSTAWTTG